ncbi:hypothetical protein ACIRBZ_32930 [Streptomyces sp. NPDC094038]|uniref:hypothetical protein n=1 Tax=Streptomyces sp. NPDC094038 TaxID=3366055 RepID=UPI0038288E3E
MPGHAQVRGGGGQQLGAEEDGDEGADGGGQDAGVEDPVEAAGQVPLQDAEDGQEQQAEDGDRGKLGGERRTGRRIAGVEGRVVGGDQLAGIRQEAVAQQVGGIAVVRERVRSAAGVPVVLQGPADEFLVLGEVVVIDSTVFSSARFPWAAAARVRRS